MALLCLLVVAVGHVSAGQGVSPGYAACALRLSVLTFLFYSAYLTVQSIILLEVTRYIFPTPWPACPPARFVPLFPRTGSSTFVAGDNHQQRFPRGIYLIDNFRNLLRHAL